MPQPANRPPSPEQRSSLPHAARARQVVSSRVLRGHVVVGVDGSDTSLTALDQAVVEAVARRAPLEIVYGWPWEPQATAVFGLAHEIALPPADAARMVLHLAEVRARRRAPELQVRQTLTTEDAAAALLRRGAAAALTVVGSRGAGGLRAMMLGSVGAGLVAHAESPVLVVRGATRGRGRIVVGVGGEQDADAVRFAIEEADRTGARLLVLHARTQPEDGRAGTAVADRVVGSLRDLLEAYPDVTVETGTVSGGADRALTAASRTADLLVIARHRHARMLGVRLGPVAHQVLHRSHCPVVLVPAN